MLKTNLLIFVLVEMIYGKKKKGIVHKTRSKVSLQLAKTKDKPMHTRAQKIPYQY